jgi:hypothetical protein
MRQKKNPYHDLSGQEQSRARLNTRPPRAADLSVVILRTPIARSDLFALPFQCIDEHGCHIEACLLLDFLKTCRTGDVDFRQAVADHVQSYQQ